MVRICIAVVLCLLALGRPAAAQFETATLVGTVTDGGGGLVTDATITVTNTDTGLSQMRQTSATGSFEFGTLRIGTYVVTAEKPGFATALADDVRLTVGARQRVDMTLQVGQLSER